MITLVCQGASVVIQLVSTVTLARLLTPQDYGVIAMVMAVTAFAGLFRDLGLSAAAIQKHTLTLAQQSNLFWINIALGASLTIVVAAASPLVASFYHRPELLWVTVAVSANFLIGSFATQSSALLAREMRFGRQLAATLSGALVSVAASIILATQGFSYWSLVWGQMAGGIVTTGLMFHLSPFRPCRPSRGTGLSEMAKFGAHVTAFDMINYFHRNLDSILIGKVWGVDALGLYTRAYSLLMFPISNLRGPVNAVAFPALGKLQNQPDGFRSYFRRVATLLAVTSMPLSAFLFAESHLVIELLLGRAWLGASPIFKVLALVSFIQPAISLWGTVLLSRQMGRRYLHLGIFNSVVTAFAFSIGVRWGAMGVATGYAAATWITAYPTLRWAFKDTPVRVTDFFAAAIPPAIASITAAVGCVTLMGRGVTVSPIATVILSAVAFTSMYVLTLRVVPGGADVYRVVFELLPRNRVASIGSCGPHLRR